MKTEFAEIKVRLSGSGPPFGKERPGATSLSDGTQLKAHEKGYRAMADSLCGLRGSTSVINIVQLRPSAHHIPVGVVPII